MAKTALPKNKNGYGYKYTDLKQIHDYLDSIGWEYYQYIEPVGGDDYIMTVKIDPDGKESAPLRGCRVLYEKTLQGGKVNDAQQMGSGLTYSRRYSLLMAFGLCTDDDDAACRTQPKEVKDQITCEVCGNAVCAVEHNGKTYSPLEIIGNSRVKYGKAICWSCMMKAKAAKRE